MDFDLEFSKQFEREESHRLFTRNTVVIQALSLCTMFVLMMISGGGSSPEFMVYAFAACVVALFSNFLLFAKNLKDGISVFVTVLFFVPAFLYFYVDALAISYFPWRSGYSFVLMAFPLIVFFISQQQSKSSGAQRILLLFTWLTYLFTVFFGFFYVIATHEGRAEDGFQIPISDALLGFLSDVGTSGAISILIFFSALIFCLRPKTPVWARLISGYIIAVSACSVFMTFDVACWFGLLAGCGVASVFLIRKRSHRVSALVLIAAGFVFTFASANFNNGVFTKISPANSLAQTADSNLENSSYLFPKVAFETFAENPILGSGSGTFSAEFDARVDAPEWQVRPKTAGSLYLTVLAENGIVGFLLLFAPVAFLIIRGINSCRRLPWHESSTENRPYDSKPGFAENRVILAGTLSGIVGVGVVFAFNYMGFSPAVFVFLAVFGGIAARGMRTYKWEIVDFVPSNGKFRKVAFSLAVIVPIVLTLLLQPIFTAEQKYTKANELLGEYFVSVKTGIPTKDASNDVLKQILGMFLSTVNMRDSHADAWCKIASVITLASRNSPEKSESFAYVINEAADRALEISKNLPEAHIAKANAQLMLGDIPDTKKSLESAESLAPQNVPVLLQIAEIYRLIPGEGKTTLRYFHKLSKLEKNSDHIRQIEALLIMDPSNVSEDSKDKQDDTVPAFNPSQFEI